MKIIQRPFFLLLWSTGFALSAAQDGPLPTSVSEYPNCVQQAQCLELASSTYCSLTPTIGCVCDTQALGFFLVLYYCALYVCSTADIDTTLGLVLNSCNKRGYNPSSIIKQALATPTYTLPSVSNFVVPASVTFPTTIFQSNNPSATGTSNPSTTSNTNTSTQSRSPSGISTAAIIGIVVGSVAVIAIIAGLIVFCMKHRAKQQAANAVPPPPPLDVSQPPPQIAHYGGSPPPGYPYATPLYQQPIIQQQQQPLMQGYQELEQPAAGYYAATKEAVVVSSSAPTTTTATPAPLPPGHQGQYFQELPAQQRPAQGGPGLPQGGQVFVEMPSDNQRR